MRTRKIKVFFLLFVQFLFFQNCGGYRSSQYNDIAKVSEDNADSSSPPPVSDPTPEPEPQPVAEEEMLPLHSAVVSDNYPHSELSWAEAYRLSGLLMKFERAPSASILGEFFSRADAVLAKRDDRSGRFSLEATWSYKPLYEAQFGGKVAVCSNAGLDGMIINPLTEFLVLAKERPELFTKWPTQVSARQSAYAKAVQETFSYHQVKSWNPAAGTYRNHADCEDVDSRGRPQADFERMPFNLIAAIGRAHFRFYLATGDQASLLITIAIAKDMRKWFITNESGMLYWPYHYFDPVTETPEDRGHGAIVVEFIKLLADHGVVFNQSTIDGLDRTVRYHILGSSGVVMDYIGVRKDQFKYCQTAGAADYYDCRDLVLWLPVIPYLNWTTLAKSFIHMDSSDFALFGEEMMIRYSRTRNYGETCTHDGECSTGSCYAGKVCGYKLSYGSTCERDADCFSGNCYAGKVCGEPLGPGSSCTRHHECVSGRCEATASGAQLCQ